MFKILIADDDYEDRELLKLEVRQALGDEEKELVFYEASSMKQARELLKSQSFDLMTLDIEFDRMTEGIDALPEIFENYPTLNIIIISGRLNKREVSDEIFQFTKNNVLKGKRWARHFDVLDKKDNKASALQHAYRFAFKQKEFSDNIRDLFLLAESHLEKDEIDKCLDVYQKIQSLAPGEHESDENIKIFRNGVTIEQAMDYYKRGEKVIASLLLGHHLETRLKAYARKILGHSIPGLYDCLKELERSHRISPMKKSLFQNILKTRNKAIHSPTAIVEEDFNSAMKDFKLLEAKI